MSTAKRGTQLLGSFVVYGGVVVSKHFYWLVFHWAKTCDTGYCREADFTLIPALSCEVWVQLCLPEWAYVSCCLVCGFWGPVRTCRDVCVRVYVCVCVCV
jgi:hypothetical protein